MAFASAGWTCSFDIQRQRGPRHLFPVTGKRYLGHHNSRLPSELPGPADPKGVSQEPSQADKDGEGGFFQKVRAGTADSRASCITHLSTGHDLPWRRHWEPLERKRQNSCESSVFAKTPSSGTLRRLATRERTRRDWRMHFRCCRHPS